MQFKSEFAQILGEFLGEETTFPPAKRTEMASFSTAEPAHLAFLLGEIRIFKREKAPSSQPHHAPFASKTTQSPLKKPHLRPHLLNEDQQLAYDWFRENGEDLCAAFTESDLKKAFRKLALRFHPDAKGGSAQRFLRLKRHEQSLRDLFKSY